MIEQKAGKIINRASQTGIVALEQHFAYCASRALGKPCQKKKGPPASSSRIQFRPCYFVTLPLFCNARRSLRAENIRMTTTWPKHLAPRYATEQPVWRCVAEPSPSEPDANLLLSTAHQRLGCLPQPQNRLRVRAGELTTISIEVENTEDHPVHLPSPAAELPSAPWRREPGDPMVFEGASSRARKAIRAPHQIDVPAASTPARYLALSLSPAMTCRAGPNKVA
jgi:hypothetical protein